MCRAWSCLLGLVCGALVGCVTPDRAVVTDVEVDGWACGASLCYANNDEQSLRTMTLFVRVDDRFLEDTLTVRIETRTPDSLRTTEWHRMRFQGEPTPASLHRVIRVPYRRSVRFAERGNYHFRITPTRTVVGVEAVGLQISNE